MRTVRLVGFAARRGEADQLLVAQAGALQAARVAAELVDGGGFVAALFGDLLGDFVEGFGHGGRRRCGLPDGSDGRDSREGVSTRWTGRLGIRTVEMQSWAGMEEAGIIFGGQEGGDRGPKAWRAARRCGKARTRLPVWQARRGSRPPPASNAAAFFFPTASLNASHPRPTSSRLSLSWDDFIMPYNARQ